ncbi:hypothetical protein [Daejeonella sp. H1SJ63]|jgi:hypothetical protein|uniref:hypothetical protein n=1 Tax=Daejeonella sp. H1SJ63 TaxID=3034145 RepID=UPI0023EB76D5|nr:hypothetical protein [Daejeonella sp. H1SJ63]
MKKEKDYIQDIAEIRSMMERSSKFLSLSGWAGIMAGIYALAGALAAYKIYDFNPGTIGNSINSENSSYPDLYFIVLLALIILILALGTAVYVSYRAANKREEKLWNTTSKRLLMNMTIPLIAGGILILILISKGMIAYVPPISLLFYGLALYSGGNFTYQEVRVMGLVQICLGLISSYFVEYGLIFWALGFGVIHIIYGIYMQYKYEK